VSAASGANQERSALLPIVLAAALAVVVLPPVWVLLEGSFSLTKTDGSAGAFTLTHFARLLDDPRLATSVTNSLVFAMCSTCVSLIFGGTLAWLVERTNVPFKRLAYLTTVISMGTPYILYVSAWLFLLGRAGPFNQLYRSALDTTDNLINVNSLTGMVLIEGFLWSPLVFLLLSASFRAANADMEEAARMSGAGIFTTLWRISLRLALPAILALALFVFIRNIEAFEVPALIGLPGRVEVITTNIYVSVKQVPPDLGRANAFSVVLLAVVAILLHFYSRLSRHAERFHSITGKGFRPRLIDLGVYRAVAGGLVLANSLIILVLPLLALLWTSFLPFARPMSPSALHLLTTKNYLAIFGSPQYLELGRNTLIVAAGAASVVMATAVLGGWLAARRWPCGWLIDQLATTPLIFPGIVLGVAALQIFLALPISLYGTLLGILIVFAVRYLPYGMRYTWAGVLQIHRELEEAAGVAGATPLGILRRVVMPLLSPAIIAGWLFIFLLGCKELSMAILLAGPDSQTIAVAMFDLWSNGQGGELAALGLMWTILLTAISAVFYVAAQRHGTTALE
jgi:iron(III) transport system permease protein